MIGTRQPKRSFAAHSLEPDYRVFYGDGERVSNMQGSRYVWRRQNHRKRCFVPSGKFVRIEKAGFFPEFINFIFYFCMIVDAWQFFVHTVLPILKLASASIFFQSRVFLLDRKSTRLNSSHMS